MKNGASLSQHGLTGVKQWLPYVPEGLSNSWCIFW